MTLHDAKALCAYLEQALAIAQRIRAELELRGDDNGDPH